MSVVSAIPAALGAMGVEGLLFRLGGKERGWEGGREEGRKGGREGKREGGRVGGRKGGEGGREEGREGPHQCAQHHRQPVARRQPQATFGFKS